MSKLVQPTTAAEANSRRRSPDAPSLEPAGIALASAAAVAAALGPLVVPPPRPLLVWNASPSSPVGLYRVSSPEDLKVGDFVVAWAPTGARQLASNRNYLPFKVPLVKAVGAVSGDDVCARGDDILVNGRRLAFRRTIDFSKRPMPWWSGCHHITNGELFLLARGKRDAFDGRYFGWTRKSEIIGRASLLWAR